VQNDNWNGGKTSRRDLLKGLGALGAGSALAATGLIAQNARKRGRIDVHHHMLPPFQPNFADRHWTPEVSLADMEKFGTETAVLSLTVAAEYLYDGTEKSRTFASNPCLSKSSPKITSKPMSLSDCAMSFASLTGFKSVPACA